ncbi:galactosyltransferase-related protein [Vibrio splendidus]|uniref:galactosyltransferase-related protein n=1 Tax=Vibrio splendidus TaxID=29497 RepID=UPI000C81CE4F|nr:galactosyltransferase-related protein [Vibrio splendidus]PMJ72617.1 hypothetical protein BCU23_16405 [Vibrio splendidus]
MIFFSIINHNHDSIIIKNENLKEISKFFPIFIKSNTPASQELIRYSNINGITLINSEYRKGFGENNNYVFNHLNERGLINDNDFFLVINPDVYISLSEVQSLEREIRSINSDIYTINLFSDKKHLNHEQSIKRFPKLTSPIRALLRNKNRNDVYDKHQINNPIKIDWAAGSFLLFKKESYIRLNGFNEDFFMYFEDAEICRRANKNKMTLTYIPSIKAMHTGAFKNRDVFSRHFLWYLKSYVRYHLKK